MKAYNLNEIPLELLIDDEINQMIIESQFFDENKEVKYYTHYIRTFGRKLI